MKKIDPHLKFVLTNFSQNYLRKREAALADLDFEVCREEVARIKDRALENLDRWLAVFEAQCLKRGGRVYRASDGIEANRIVFQIMKESGANYLIKSKSMVSEEIGLNAFLESHGIKVRETDLGEWIIQLRQEKPTHMVMPAIHLTRKEVADTFSQYLKKKVHPEIKDLVEVARQELRQDVLRAEVGLLGANALIAETGSVMILTNEGNGRLVSLFPPTRIILASVEKILPTLQDAFAILKLLPPNATGQTITSYVSFLTPSFARPLHIILLDNHRTEILADRLFRVILRCLKCSACLNVCPVYQVLGGKNFGAIYQGGIGTLLTAWLQGLSQSRELAEKCLGCHHCEAVCAAKIPIADLIIALKERLIRQLGKPFWKRVLFDGAMAKPSRWRKILSALGAARPLVAQANGFLRQLPTIFRKYDQHRALPAPARLSLSKRIPDKETRLTEIELPSQTVVFPGCLIEYFYPQIGEAALRVLARLGHKARLSKSGCCGFPAFNSGFKAAATNALKAVLADLEKAERVLTLCPTCTSMLKHYGPKILAIEMAKRVAERVSPLCPFLFEFHSNQLETFFASPLKSIKATYHDSCHHKYKLKASEASRLVLELALGKKIQAMDRSDACCGFGGIFFVVQPEISASLLQDKLDFLERSGAELVAMDCPGCLLQIRGGLERRNLPIKAKHTIEVIDACFSGKF
ncbi:MAG: LUD domain-containing protein [Candidatus Aminicenantes bacterium]|nr:LUD domain-containing protein [Candidatus Aminicenantes bacterium]